METAEIVIPSFKLGVGSFVTAYFLFGYISSLVVLRWQKPHNLEGAVVTVFSFTCFWPIVLVGVCLIGIWWIALYATLAVAAPHLKGEVLGTSKEKSLAERL